MTDTIESTTSDRQSSRVPTPPAVSADLTERMAEAMRGTVHPKMSISSVVPTSPHAPGWDHSRKCMPRADAQLSRDRLRKEIGTMIGGRKVRWRVRPCILCDKFYVDCDGASRGDISAQRRRQRERQRLAKQAAKLAENGR